MKKNPSPFCLFILSPFFILLPGFSWGGSPGEWDELPALVFKDSVEVETVIAPNPYSEKSNDFLVVTKYEEGEKGGAVGSRSQKGSQPIKSLNVYLVTGLILLDEGDVGIPYHTSLIVSLRISGDSRTIQQWVLSDSDGDGELDEGRFQKVSTRPGGEAVRSGPVEISKKQIGKYQSYYEKASRELNDKADISLGD